MASAALRDLTTSWNFLSSSACNSASFTICSTSSSVKPEPALISMRCSLPVALSLAETCKIPFESISNSTSICGIPRGAGLMPCKSKRPKDLFAEAISRSPCKT